MVIDFWIFLTILIFILFLFYLFLLWRSKRQLKKLRRDYNEEEDNSRRIGIGREIEGRTGRISKPIGINERDDKPQGRGLFQTSTTSDRESDNITTEKVESKPRRFFRRRRKPRRRARR